MTTAELEKRVRTLEKGYEELRRAVVRHAASSTSSRPMKKNEKKKKLPAGLRQGLKEWRDGKVSGPFNTVEEFIADLEA